MTLPVAQFCANCAAILAPGARFCGTCGRAVGAVGPVAAPLKQPNTVEVGGNRLELAGIGSRLGALLIDGVVFWLFAIPLFFFHNPFAFRFAQNGELIVPVSPEWWVLAFPALSLLIGWLWECLGWSVGKAMAGIRVRRSDGRRPGLVHGLSRATIKAAAKPLFLGYLWAIWDDKRQAWHDKTADTYVVNHFRRGDLPRDGQRSPIVLSSRTLWWTLGGTALWLIVTWLNLQLSLSYLQWPENFRDEFEPRERTIATAPLHPEPSEVTATLRGAAPPDASYPPVFSSNSTQFPSGSSTIAIRSPGRTSSGPEGTS